jgi:hypothetical protein
MLMPLLRSRCGETIISNGMALLAAHVSNPILDGLAITISHLELTIPRLSDRGPSTLEQPIPTCEANQEDLPANDTEGNEAPL